MKTVDQLRKQLRLKFGKAEASDGVPVAKIKLKQRRVPKRSTTVVPDQFLPPIVPINPATLVDKELGRYGRQASILAGAEKHFTKRFGRVLPSMTLPSGFDKHDIQWSKVPARDKHNRLYSVLDLVLPWGRGATWLVVRLMVWAERFGMVRILPVNEAGQADPTLLKGDLFKSFKVPPGEYLLHGYMLDFVVALWQEQG